jgi:hypothetical protein
MKRVAAAAVVACSTQAFATQVVPQVEYTNDSIEQGGVIRARMISAAMIDPPQPETEGHGLAAGPVTAAT